MTAMFAPTPQTEFAEALAHLTSLSLLKLHLDFAFMSGPEIGYVGSRWQPPTISDFDDKLERAAGELSRTLSPSLQEIGMFKYEVNMIWVVFAVTRGISLDGKPHTGVV